MVKRDLVLKKAFIIGKLKIRSKRIMQRTYLSRFRIVSGDATRKGSNSTKQDIDMESCKDVSSDECMYSLR